MLNFELFNFIKNPFLELMKLKITFCVLFLSASFHFLWAQDEDNRTAVGLYLSKAEYRGDYGSALWNFNTNFNLGGAFSLQRYLSPTFDGGVQGGYGKYGYGSSFSGKKYDAFIYANVKLNNGYIFREKSVVSPFLTGGLGFARYHGGIPDAKNADFILPLGAGVKFQLTENIGLEYKYIVHFTSNDNRDGLIASKGKNDIYGQHFAGIIISFGGVDSDKDGVKDKKDLCPNTPLGVLVDKNGCPLDSDGDGVPDYLDECPAVPGSKLFNGCPDSDGDGVPDHKDQCPDTPEVVKGNRRGCPLDTDGDGIPDYLDKCPNVAGLAKFEGCPDSDGDGIPDHLDKCPDTPQGVKVDSHGCPIDTDGDGVPDYLDKCPDLRGSAANSGCPELAQETKDVLIQALHGIQFETGKSFIKKQSNAVLDKVVKIMRENPLYNLEIIGHTDNQGSEPQNQALSEKRAQAVMKYMNVKGINTERISAKGVGATQPITENKTPNGRYLNRRVELKIVF